MAHVPVPSAQTILRTLRSGLRSLRYNLSSQGPRLGPLKNTMWQQLIIESVISLTLLSCHHHHPSPFLFCFVCWWGLCIPHSRHHVPMRIVDIVNHYM